jgi:hypothetical protein
MRATTKLEHALNGTAGAVARSIAKELSVEKLFNPRHCVGEGARCPNQEHMQPGKGIRS